MNYAFTDIKATKAVIHIVAAQFDSYCDTPIPSQISVHDQMFAVGVKGAMAHYMNVGQSAIEVIAHAMICAGKATIGSVLDLPCGGGRVTRHLRAFFTTANLFVGELNIPARQFAAENFGATIIDVKPDFTGHPERSFDLVFVGSLVTHFNAEQFARALRWFIRSLASDGLLVMTTHGRRHDQIEREMHHGFSLERWAAMTKSYQKTGFGYIETERLGGLSYGTSWSAPSWIMRLVEDDPSVTIVSFQEAAWDRHQDVLVVQKTE